MTGASNHYANQKSQSQWKRYTAPEMQLVGAPGDPRRTWQVKLPDNTILSSSYQFLPKDSMKQFEAFNIIILDGADRKVAQTLTDYNMKNLDMSRLSHNSICHLRSMFHFNERMMMATGNQKKLYWRVIPEIDLGNETRGPEEGRILTEGLWEMLFTVRARQGRKLRTDDDRVGALEVKYNSTTLNTIPLSELEEILEDFDIDKSMITLIDDPMHMISEREAYKLGCPVKTYNLIGQPIMSFNQAMLFLTEALICGVDWRKKTVQERCEMWQYIEVSMEPIISTNHYIPYSVILKRIIEYKRSNPAMHADQCPLSTFLIQHERPGEYLRTHAEIQECAIRFGYEANVFTDRNTQVWQLRVQGIFSAVQMFIDGVETCTYLDMTIRDALMFLISSQRRSTYRMFFDEKEIFDLDEDEDERCRVYLKLERRDYHFHFHNKHTIRGTKARRDVSKYIPKFTKYVLHGCAPESTSSDTKKIRRRCRKCRARVEELDDMRKVHRQQRNHMSSFMRGEWDRYRHIRDQMKVIRAKKRELERREMLRAMPAQNEKMEFEVNSYKISLPLLEMETKEEQENCEELYRKNQELRKEEARLMSQLEVEDIVNLCFNKEAGRLQGPNQPLWVPQIKRLLNNLQSDVLNSPTRKDSRKPRMVRQTFRGKAKHLKKETPAYTDGKVERFLEKLKLKQEEESCNEVDYNNIPSSSTTRKSKNAKAAKAKSFKTPDPKSLEIYVKKEMKEQISVVEEPERDVEDHKMKNLLTTVAEEQKPEVEKSQKVLEKSEPEEAQSVESPLVVERESAVEKSKEILKESEVEVNAEKQEECLQNEAQEQTESEIKALMKSPDTSDAIALHYDQMEHEIQIAEEPKEELRKVEQVVESESPVSAEPPKKVQESETQLATATEDVKEIVLEQESAQHLEAPPTETTIEKIEEEILEQPKKQDLEDKAPEVSEFQDQEAVTTEKELEISQQEMNPEIHEVKTLIEGQDNILEASDLSKVESSELNAGELKPEAQSNKVLIETPIKITHLDQEDKIPKPSDLPKVIEKSEVETSEIESDAQTASQASTTTSQDETVQDVVEGLLVPLQSAEVEKLESDEVEGLEERMKNLEIKDDAQGLNFVESATSSEAAVSKEPSKSSLKLTESQTTSKEAGTSEDHQKENQTPEDQIMEEAQTSTTVTPLNETPETQLSQPCSSASITSSKNPMEAIQLNYMAHQDPAILIQQLFEEMKDSKSRPSKIQVDVRNKEIDEKDLTSPSSVPEDPATSWKTLKMLSNQKQSPSFELVIQSQAAIQEKDRRIEELEKLCQALEAKNEQMEQQLSENQPSTSSTSTETQLKLELQEKESKILELEDSNRELQLKIKHQEEFIDKLLKR